MLGLSGAGHEVRHDTLPYPSMFGLRDGVADSDSSGIAADRGVG